jgi:hypothetical protein
LRAGFTNNGISSSRVMIPDRISPVTRQTRDRARKPG